MTVAIDRVAQRLAEREQKQADAMREILAAFFAQTAQKNKAQQEAQKA